MSNEYGAIPLTIANDVGSNLKKKMGSLTGFAPVDWAETINKLGNKLPERTVSGAVCTFADGADDVPMPSVKASITAVQAGSGDPSPSNVRAISGFAECDATHTKKNVICSNDASFPMSENGIACPLVTSGNKNTLIFEGHLSLGKWTLKENAPNASNTTHQMALIKNATIVRYITVDPYTFTVESEDDIYKVRLYVYANNTETYVKPQLEKGDTASDYESYAGETIPVWMGGVNTWDEQWEVGGYNNTTGEPYANTDRIRSKANDYIRITPSTTYYFKSTATAYMFFYKEDKTFIRYDEVTKDTTFTTPSNAYYMRFRMAAGYGTTYGNDISINYPATETGYNACRYIYGGELNLTTGVLTVDRQGKTLDGTEDWQLQINGQDTTVFKLVNAMTVPDQNNQLCSHFTYNANANTASSDRANTFVQGTSGNLFIQVPNATATTTTAFKTWLASNNVTYVARLSPTTIQLTPEEVRSFLGTNNLWANTGDSEVTYYAQPNVPTEVLYKGQISTTSGYATANFTESVADDEEILVKVYCPARSAVDYKVIKVSDIGNGLNVGFNLHTTVNCTITKTSIASYQYSGDYYDIYADVLAYDSAIFN